MPLSKIMGFAAWLAIPAPLDGIIVVYAGASAELLPYGHCSRICQLHYESYLTLVPAVSEYFADV